MNYSSFSFFQKIFAIYLFAVSFSFVVGCSNTTENETIVNQYEDRAVYVGDDGNLYSVTLDGEKEYICDFYSLNTYFFSFSLDAIQKKIVYRPRDINKIFISNYDGSNKIAVDIEVKSNEYVMSQRSPNGDLVICQVGNSFYRFDMDGKNIILLNADDNITLKKTNTDNFLNLFPFSSDGKYFAYIKNDTNIVVRDLSGNKLGECNAKYPFCYSLSPTADAIYYIKKEISPIDRVSFHKFDIKNNVDNEITLPGGAVAEYCTISSDGKTLALSISKEAYNSPIYLYDLGSNTLSPGIEEGMLNMDPVFNTSGDKIIYEVDRSLFLINKNGTGKRMIADKVSPSWGLMRFKK